jgi:hypothetical protein
MDISLPSIREESNTLSTYWISGYENLKYKGVIVPVYVTM